MHVETLHNVLHYEFLLHLSTYLHIPTYCLTVVVPSCTSLHIVLQWLYLHAHPYILFDSEYTYSIHYLSLSCMSLSMWILFALIQSDLTSFLDYFSFFLSFSQTRSWLLSFSLKRSDIHLSPFSFIIWGQF